MDFAQKLDNVNEQNNQNAFELGFYKKLPP